MKTNGTPVVAFMNRLELPVARANERLSAPKLEFREALSSKAPASARLRANRCPPL